MSRLDYAGLTRFKNNLMAMIGVANGVAGLDSNGKVNSAQLPGSLAAANGGTDLSLVTTGEKYNWNNIDLSTKADKAGTVLTTTLSRGRLANSTVGTGSFAFGNDVEASGSYSHAEGEGTAANHKNQHVFGKYNIEDSSILDSSEIGTYVEIVGNGTSSTHSNARTLDWSGNEALAGSLTCNTSITMGSSTITASQWEILRQFASDMVAANGVSF